VPEGNTPYDGFRDQARGDIVPYDGGGGGDGGDGGGGFDYLNTASNVLRYAGLSKKMYDSYKNIQEDLNTFIDADAAEAGEETEVIMFNHPEEPPMTQEQLRLRAKTKQYREAEEFKQVEAATEQYEAEQEYNAVLEATKRYESGNTQLPVDDDKPFGGVEIDSSEAGTIRREQERQAEQIARDAEYDEIQLRAAIEESKAEVPRETGTVKTVESSGVVETPSDMFGLEGGAPETPTTLNKWQQGTERLDAERAEIARLDAENLVAEEMPPNAPLSRKIYSASDYQPKEPVDLHEAITQASREPTLKLPGESAALETGSAEVRALVANAAKEGVVEEAAVGGGVAAVPTLATAGVMALDTLAVTAASNAALTQVNKALDLEGDDDWYQASHQITNEKERKYWENWLYDNAETWKPSADDKAKLATMTPQEQKKYYNQAHKDTKQRRRVHQAMKDASVDTHEIHILFDEPGGTPSFQIVDRAQLTGKTPNPNTALLIQQEMDAYNAAHPVNNSAAANQEDNAMPTTGYTTTIN